QLALLGVPNDDGRPPVAALEDGGPAVEAEVTFRRRQPVGLAGGTAFDEDRPHLLLAELQPGLLRRRVLFRPLPRQPPRQRQHATADSAAPGKSGSAHRRDLPAGSDTKLGWASSGARTDSSLATRRGSVAGNPGSAGRIRTGCAAGGWLDRSAAARR